jgi:hypothetical protein
MESCDKPQEGNYGKDAYRSALFLKYVNCTEKTTFTAQIIRYPTLYGAGKPTESLQFPVRPEGFSDVAPNTLGAAWLRLVCAAK